MKILSTPLEGVLLIQPDLFKDSRGYFTETYQKQRYATKGIDCSFVQDNLSFSNKHTLRGLHYQLNHPQAKLVYVVKGSILDVAVDIRSGSPSFGQWTGAELSDGNMRQLFIPKGFAHGFCVLSKTAYVAYKCSDFYDPEDERGVLWSDPDIDITWPSSNPVLSLKDKQFLCLKDLSEKSLPTYNPKQIS